MIPSLFDRLDYHTLDENNYLNQASLGPIGQPAVTAMHEFAAGKRLAGQRPRLYRANVGVSSNAGI